MVKLNLAPLTCEWFPFLVTVNKIFVFSTEELTITQRDLYQ